MCVSDFWVLPDRMRLTPFTMPFDSDDFYLKVLTKPVQVSESLAHMLEQPFMPFSRSLWLTNIGLKPSQAITVCDNPAIHAGFLVLVGCAMSYVDAEHTEEFTSDKMWVRALKGMYLAAAGYVSGGPIHRPKSSASQIVLLGYGLFILITIASYTVNSILPYIPTRAIL